MLRESPFLLNINYYVDDIFQAVHRGGKWNETSTLYLSTFSTMNDVFVVSNALQFKFEQNDTILTQNSWN